MKITGFSINMGAERTYTSMESSFSKRETFVNPLTSVTGLSSGDRVSISREKASKILNESGFRANSKTIVKRKNTDAVESAKPAIEIMTKALTGRNITLTNLYTKSVEERSSNLPIQRSQQDLQQESIMRISTSYIHKERESISIASSGTIKTQDGMEISFNLLLEMQRGLVREEQEVTIGDARLLTDPLVINLSGGAPELSESLFSFDIDSDGAKDKIHSLGKGTGFLAFDRNGDGQINNGTELFGPSSGNGFSDLSALDQNNDGWIDENDDAFSKLVIWTRDENGESKLTDLESAGIGAIFTGSADSEFSLTGKDGQTDGMMRKTGIYVKNSGEVQNIFQMDLAKEMPETSQQSTSTARAGGREQNPIDRIAAARAEMLNDAREKLGKMKENMKKSLVQKDDSISGSAKDELMEKIQKRLEDLMKFFDAKLKETRTSSKKPNIPFEGKISTYA